MADREMRLRLVVRRNGLPEVRLMWNVLLNGNSTISRLLEQLNVHIPLESGSWGLEDYVVELHDNDGTAFECLHYQLVQNVLRPDDRVFIRALDRDDHRRRRISGRAQIASDGRHLIDGVPFGRPLLRAPSGRPAVRIPPRKRIRLTLSQPDGDSFTPLLTNGEPFGDQQTGPHTQSAADSGDINADSDDADFSDEEAESSSSDGLHLEDEEDAEGEGVDDSDDGEEDGDHENETNWWGEEGDDEDLDQEARDLAMENAALDGNSPPRSQPTNIDTHDKTGALRAAFPMAPAAVCEMVLAASEGDVKATYDALSEGFTPRMTREAVLEWNPISGNRGLRLEGSSAPAHSASSGHNITPSTRKRKLRERSPSEHSQDDEDEDLDTGLVRKYDHAGFPPGTITSGQGLAHMATVSTSFGSSKAGGNSETTSTTLKAAADELDDEDDDTSSSGTSSSSSAGDDKSEAGVEKGSSSDRSSQSSSTSSDGSDSEGSDAEPENDDPSPSSPTSESPTSDSGSDSGPEERPSGLTSRSSSTSTSEASESSDHASGGGSAEANSSSESSSSESEDSEDDGGGDLRDQAPSSNALAPTKNAPGSSRYSSNLTQRGVETNNVPPGAGKQSTKLRNARRRAAKLAKKQMQISHAHDTSVTNNTDADGIAAGDGQRAADDEAALFAAKRKALLDALAAGGVEVEPLEEDGLPKTDRVKRKRTVEDDANLGHDDSEVAINTTNGSPGNDEVLSPASQKRRRLDLGASRRLVFGALGLRNPKNKQDEEKLRNQLQNNAPTQANQPLSSPSQSRTNELMTDCHEKDPDAWKLKINYRAVECCHDGIELTSPPFPFQQRWDPQQQYSSSGKSGKRGGRSKRALRDQSQYYEENRNLSKKRNGCDPSKIASNVDDGAYDEGDDNASNVDITLNYDDIESQNNAPANETSLATDLDDLPSLPEDVSTLPTLRPGEALVGMVIAWQKWSCSSATSWQPQLSWVTAIVAKIDDEAAALDLCLAKRDRYLDGIEKRYNKTGQRIYDRFEAPDLHEEEDGCDETDVDDGYRSVSWADLQNPRVVQQPLVDAMIESDAGSKQVSFAEADEPEQIHDEGDSFAGSNSKSSPTPEETPGDSNTAKSWAQVSNDSGSYQAGQGQRVLADISISEFSELNSPSRQLLETTREASLASASNTAPASSQARPSDGEGATSPQLGAPDFISLAPPSSLSSAEKDFEDDVVTVTPAVLQSQADVPTPASSGPSEPLPDYTMTDLGGDVSGPSGDSDQLNGDLEATSSPHVFHSPNLRLSGRTLTPDFTKETGKSDAAGPSPTRSSSSSSSLPSLNSIWLGARASQQDQSPSKAKASAPERMTMSQPSMRPTNRGKMGASKFSGVVDRPSSQAADILKVKLEASSQPLPRKKRPSKPFTLPPNTQVFELSSDSEHSEPAYAENYADDDVDETYSPKRIGLPKGDGWVKKKKESIGKARRGGGRRSIR